VVWDKMLIKMIYIERRKRERKDKRGRGKKIR
jgi:hypothetical protein